MSKQAIGEQIRHLERHGYVEPDPAESVAELRAILQAILASERADWTS